MYECLILTFVWNGWMQSGFAELFAVPIPLALKLKFGGTIIVLGNMLVIECEIVRKLGV